MGAPLPLVCTIGATMIDAEELKKELSKAPVWATLTIIELIDKMEGANDERSNSQNDK